MNRNRWFQLGLVLLVGIALMLVPTHGVASNVDPGSAEDPLVAKSYLDQLVRLQVLELEAGEVLRGEAGTELILRAGQAIAITAPQGGISDLTAGRDIQSQEAIPANHLLLIPRSDGRGLKTITNVVVLVRGGVTLD
ncbi:MAG TPA: hypothetical protein GXX69_06095 [Firmicutes bacterium]|jgi:hypothetical protein|nr:hypothetical protein [Bacillota bacterium]